MNSPMGESPTELHALAKRLAAKFSVRLEEAVTKMPDEQQAMFCLAVLEPMYSVGVVAELIPLGVAGIHTILYRYPERFGAPRLHRDGFRMLSLIEMQTIRDMVITSRVATTPYHGGVRRSVGTKQPRRGTRLPPEVAAILDAP